jgi:hypothetical protein
MTLTTAITFGLFVTTFAASRGDAVELATVPDALILRGLELRRTGHPTQALELFRRAHDSSPSPRTLGQMGLVETSLKMWSDADAHLAAALATPGDRWVRQNRAFLAEAQTRVRGHVGDLVVTGPPGVRLSVAGKEIGELPLRAPLRLAEGDLRLTATADGRKPVAVEVRIQGGMLNAVTVVLDPLELDARPPPAISPPPPVVDARPIDRRRWIGGALVAAGAGALIWGVVWLQLDGRASCFDVTRERACAAYDTQSAGLALTLGGGVMLLAGGALIYTALRSSTAQVSVSATPRAVRFEARF